MTIERGAENKSIYVYNIKLLLYYKISLCDESNKISPKTVSSSCFIILLVEYKLYDNNILYFAVQKIITYNNTVHFELSSIFYN